MKPLDQLLQDKRALEADIEAQKPDAVAKVKALMAELGLTWADLGVAPVKPIARRAVKYRDEVGNTWTGVGQRPRWLAARLLMGHDLEQFRVKEK